MKYYRVFLVFRKDPIMVSWSIVWLTPYTNFVDNVSWSIGVSRLTVWQMNVNEKVLVCKEIIYLDEW